MKIAVVGSRKFKHKQVVESIVYRELKNYHVHSWLDGVESSIISGGAKGVDTWAEEISDNFGMSTLPDNHKHCKKIFLPEYDKYGRRACFIRNSKIINESDCVLAFWDGESKGTKMSIDLAIKAGKPVDIYIRS